MAPALELPQIGQEMLACAVMGGILGAIRTVFPKRGRAAFLLDVLYVGMMLFCLQSCPAAIFCALPLLSSKESPLPAAEPHTAPLAAHIAEIIFSVFTQPLQVPLQDDEAHRRRKNISPRLSHILCR